MMAIRNTNRAFYCTCTAVLLLIISTLWLMDQYSNQISDKVAHVSYLVNTSGCVIPEMDPFDPSVAWLYTSKSDLECEGPPSLLIVDYERRTIKIDGLVSTHHYKEDPVSLRCVVRTIARPMTFFPDNNLLMSISGQYLTLEEMHITSEFIYVQCKNSLGKEVYSDYIPFIQKKLYVEERIINYKRRVNEKKQPEGQTRLNVMLLGIDSISRLNFLRHFPRTYRYIVETLRGFDFVGYNKVADNTLLNVIPLLTGMHASEAWNGDVRKPFDGLNFIWKRFSRNGYRTLYAEESPTQATFNYMYKGFYKQPVDYYYRPFTIATEQSSIMTSTAHCFKKRMEVDVVLQWLYDFHRMFQNDAAFSLTFITRLTHDYLNNAGLADRPYYDFLKKGHSEGIFNNTILFFFSDHGFRFGRIRNTYIGKLEERMPFLYIILPEWFSVKYPYIWENLKTNQRRLTSPFDVYATMVDVIHSKLAAHSEPSENPVNQRGLSLFTSIPESRTCEDAGISAHWCVCHVKMPVGILDRNVQKAAQLIVQVINDKLLPLRNVCAVLAINRVIDARVSTLNKDVLKYNSKERAFPFSPVYDYLVTLKVTPSNGTFEGTVRFWNIRKEFKVFYPISRISRYDNQSVCVNSTELRLYCYCLN